MGIALPTWVIESQNNVWVLGVYGLVFGVGLPFLVVSKCFVPPRHHSPCRLLTLPCHCTQARWWYGSRSRTKDHVYNATAQSFFQHLRDDTPLLRLISLLAISEEFHDEKLDVRYAIALARGKPVGKAGKSLDELEKAVREQLNKWGPEAALPPEVSRIVGVQRANDTNVTDPTSALSSALHLSARPSSCSTPTFCASTRPTCSSARKSTLPPQERSRFPHLSSP